MSISNAPWTYEQVQELRRDQLEDPITCISHPDLRLQVGVKGLYCVMCGYTQEWVVKEG